MRAIFAVLLVAIAAPALAVDDSDLVRRQADQRRARAMTSEMVSTVLDLQLRQLEENGLTDLPIYGDIRTMRGNLARLVDAEMAGAVERLVEAQQAAGGERDAKIVEARRAIREVVVRLSVERQSLLRRLKAAELAEQTRRLIELQSAARETTASLPGLPSERRPETALRVIEDQRDVKRLFARLVETLTEVRTWDGPIATAASDGLRALKTADVAARLDSAEMSLDAASFEVAVSHQDKVLDALRKLLGAVEDAESPLDTGSSDLAEAARRILERQQALHEQMKREGLSDPAEPEAVEAQQRVANDLAELATRLAADPAAEPLRRQAETAARAAAESLFVEDEARTLDEQQRAVDRLTSLVAALEAGGTDERRDRSAAELEQLAGMLGSAREGLKQAAEEHATATRVASADRDTAAASERAASEQAAKLAAAEGLPPAVASRLADAADAARAAGEQVAAGGDSAKSDAASSALAEAGDAFQRAQAAVEEALADTRRAEAAVRVGELARAAEALERAAAAERHLASQAERAAAGAGLSPEQIDEMKQTQSDVAGVATKTAEGVRDAAPQVAETLGRALEASNETDQALARAGGSAGESAKAAAGEAGERAKRTAGELSRAAASLRGEIGETAGALAALAGEQLQPVAAAQEAVAEATEAVEGGSPTAAEASDRAAESSAQAETDATAASQIAERAASRQSGKDASDALDRAAISLAAREQQLVRDQQLAKRLAELATRQQSAVGQIEQAREALADAPSDPAAMSPQQRQSAEALHGATRQFAAAQRATGQGAVQVSGQQQVANLPIREALEAAERLPVPQLPGRPAPQGEQVAQGEPAEQPTPQGGPTQAADSGAQGEKAAGEAQGESGQGTPSDTSQAPGNPSQATGLGKGLVPAAPGETARMMAGADAQATLAAMDALQGIESMEDLGETETEMLAEGGTPQNPNAGDDVATNNPPASGPPSSDGSPAGSGQQTPDAAGRDADVGAAGGDAGWLAKLPPEVRAAIRASSSQPAPKAYEGRLRRYFESVDK